MQKTRVPFIHQFQSTYDTIIWIKNEALIFSEQNIAAKHKIYYIVLWSQELTKASKKTTKASERKQQTPPLTNH